VSTNVRNAKLGQKGSCAGPWPTFGILGPSSISGTNEARNFKYGWQRVLTIKSKIKSNGVMWVHVTHFY